jgi:hypothetical protein
VNLWTEQPAAVPPVDKCFSSPVGAHSPMPLQERKRGVIPELHTLYDYDKGIS